MSSVHVRVPATAANLGPGFDALAVALDLHNELEIRVIDSTLEVEIEGEGEGQLPTDASNLIARAAYRLFRTAETPPPGMHMRSTNRIPIGSGLGSSAAAVIAGLIAANEIAGSGFEREHLLEIAGDLEGHADNAAAALFGGLTIVGRSTERLMTAQITLAPMQFAVVTPEIALPTNEMRDVLPRNVTLHDAALNLGRMGIMVEALRNGDFELLAGAAEDRLHEPYRSTLIPGFSEARSAGLNAGAAAVTLAGAGPSVIAFAHGHHEAIADAIAGVFRANGASARKFVLDPDPHGARLLGSTE